MTEPEVVLVNEQDVEIGRAAKSLAHQDGLLHRAFSVFVFDKSGRLMLQKRAADKYHSGGLWTNTCCSHQAPGETTTEAAHRRLHEEMGFDCALSPLFEFYYKVRFENGIFEHEYDHVLFGFYDQNPVINTQEVAQWSWASVPEIRADLQTNPQKYTYWFALVFEKVVLAMKGLKSAT